MPRNNEGKSSFLQNIITFMPFSSLLYPLAPNSQPFHPRLQPLNWRLHLLHQYLHPFLRLVTRLGTNWGHYHCTTNITAIFTAIICCIAWVQSPFMKEAKNDLCFAKRQSQAREHPFCREQAKNIYFAIQVRFLREVCHNSIILSSI